MLCVMNRDGSKLREMKRAGSTMGNPQFSPDGKTILVNGVIGPCVVNVDDSQSPLVLPIRIGGLNARSPVYSPDGRSVAFAFALGQFASSVRIFISNVDGSRLRQLPYPAEEGGTAIGEGCAEPSFMPDGKRILFLLHSWPDGPFGSGKENLWEVGVDGNNLHQIADYRLFDDPLGWKRQ